MKDDWDLVSSPVEDTSKTNFKDAVPTLRPQRPSVKRKAVSGSSITIIVLSIAVIGLSVFTGLNIFHVINFNGTASASTQPLSGTLATVEAEATRYAAISNSGVSHPAGTYQGPGGCPDDGKNYYIVNAKTGLVLDVSGGSKEIGATILQYPDNGGGLNQLWQFESVGSYFEIVNVNSGLPMEPQSTAQTAPAPIVQSSNSAAPNQQWLCVFVNNNLFKIESAYGSLVLEVANNDLTQITPLLEDFDTGGLNQQWLFVL